MYHPVNGEMESRVGFRGEVEEPDVPRVKYLTAKYGQHQMKLIRKRLAVEDWLDKELRRLYKLDDESLTYPCDIDLDDVLDCETDLEKHQFVKEKVLNSNQTTEKLHKFITDVIEKSKTL